ncbi:ABC transporter permease [Anaeromyxobacter dehalogenans]|uniref:ABC-2 type transporter transmembrane domain-containing protein n=1 Tax=Anaeromyxobacter dehalogenans (strain 2CP-C) TaxID=290397 RepID=Q2IQ83_ANADE|nr:ABC transporter permease [Anaeromyxobacter dehalogenans]ABC80961.1 hypothetical protein Adeh_1187 [Anaeromyxobacter dehalogenans 2CP-C]
MTARAWQDVLRASAREERGRIFRERSILLVLVAIPLLYPVIVAYLYHAEDARDRPALLLDLDGSALSRRVALELEATPELRVARRVASLDDGMAALRRDEAELLVVVPPDFSRRLKRGEQAQLAVWAGGANMYTWAIAYPAAVTVAGATGARVRAAAFLAKGMPPAVARARAAPIATGDRLLYHPTGSYGRYLAAGIFLVVLQQLVVVSLAFSAGARLEAGLPPAGREPLPLARLLGMAAAHAPFWLAGVVFIGLVLMPAMGWAGPSVLATATLLLAFAVVMVPVAIGLASLARDRMGTFQLLMFFSVPLFLASGFTWPPGQLPRAVELATAVFPATPALRALRVLVMKTGDLGAVAPQLAWLGALLVLHSAVAALVVHRASLARRLSALRRKPGAEPPAALPRSTP